MNVRMPYQENEIGISLWRSVVGISVALVAGLAAGLVVGSFKTAMALLKPVITILLAMPPIIWVVMALFWFRQSERVVYHHCVGCAADVCECGGWDGEREQAA